MKGFKEAPMGAAGAAATQPPHHAGHRDRLRERFLRGGADAMPDYELLELVLFRAIPRRDVKPLAKDLLQRLGSFAEVLNAAPERLAETPGLGDAAIAEIKIIQAAALRLIRSEVLTKPILSSWEQVMDYCTASMARLKTEQFRILFLDKRNRLIEDEVLQEGTVDHAPVYVREVLKRALELAATAIVIVHNHPSGDPTPSASDIATTRDIITAGGKLGVTVHDHLVVGRERRFSFRAAGLI